MKKTSYRQLMRSNCKFKVHLDIHTQKILLRRTRRVYSFYFISNKKMKWGETQNTATGWYASLDPPAYEIVYLKRKSIHVGKWKNKLENKKYSECSCHNIITILKPVSPPKWTNTHRNFFPHTFWWNHQSIDNSQQRLKFLFHIFPIFFSHSRIKKISLRIFMQ